MKKLGFREFSCGLKAHLLKWTRTYINEVCRTAWLYIPPWVFFLSWPQLDLSWGLLHNPWWPMAGRVTWGIKEREANRVYWILTTCQILHWGFIPIISANPQNTASWKWAPFTTGQLERLRLTAVEGPAPGCPGSPWYLDYQDLAGPRALVVSKALPAEGKMPGSHRVWGQLPGCKRKL